MESVNAESLATLLQALKLENEEKPLLDLGFSRQECLDMILVNNNNYEAAAADLLKRQQSRGTSLEGLFSQLRRLEEYIIAHPLVVPFLEKHFLRPEVYAGLYGLLALFFLTHMLNLDNTSYVITGYVFQKCFGLMTLCVHLSIYVQLFGMVGSTGVFPAKKTIAELRKDVVYPLEYQPQEVWEWVRYNIGKYFKVHTLCWFGTSDVFLFWKSALGIAAAACFTLGIYPPVSMLVSNLVYLSWIIIGKEFFRLQFDSLVVELGWMAMLMYPMEGYSSHVQNSFAMRLEIFLVWFAVLRLHLASGACKIRSGDENWRNGTALSYHYWTTPLPNWTGWYLSAYLPKIVHVMSVAMHFVIELVVVVFLLFPPTRAIGFWGVFILQFVIIATGNFGSFNYFSAIAALCVLDDSMFPTFLQDWFFATGTPSRFSHLFLGFEHVLAAFTSFSAPDSYLIMFPYHLLMSLISLLLTMFAIVHACLYINLSFPQLFRFFKGPKSATASELSQTLNAYIAKTVFEDVSLVETVAQNPTFKPVFLAVWAKLYYHSSSFKVFCYYGVFATMTTHRDEIIMEGWDKNEQKWKEYHLYYKPSDVLVAPRWIVPGHLPRLDWMLWFCSLRKDPWTRELMFALLNGSHQALSLFRVNPFPVPEEPPTKVRFTLWSFAFTTKEERAETHAWWIRKYRKLYDDVFMLDESFRSLIKLSK